MHFLKSSSDKTELQKFAGVPNVPTSEEKSRWKKFLGFFWEWLKQKKELGESYLIAKVENEKAEAALKYADAHLKSEQANKISIEAAALEREKLKEINFATISNEDIEAKWLEIEDQLKKLFALYGLKLDIKIDDENSSELGDVIDEAYKKLTEI